MQHLTQTDRRMEAEEDLVSAVQAARNAASGMHLDEPDALALAVDSSAAHQSNYAGAILLVLGSLRLRSCANDVESSCASCRHQHPAVPLECD